MILALSILVGVLMLPILLLVGGLLGNRVPLFEPPGFGNRVHRYLTTNVAETSDSAVLPELRPLHSPLASDAAYERALGVVEGLGWKVEESVEKERTIHAVITTPMFRFQDDFKIEIEQQTGERGSVISVQSRSRVGKGDLGANLRHVLDFRSALESAGIVEAAAD